jgi:hypothetical protein
VLVDQPDPSQPGDGPSDRAIPAEPTASRRLLCCPVVVSPRLSVHHSSVMAFQPSDLGFKSDVLLHQIVFGICRFVDAVSHNSDLILKVCNLSLQLLVFIPSFCVLAGGER